MPTWMARARVLRQKRRNGKGCKPWRDDDGYQPGRGHRFGPIPGDSPSASSSSSEEEMDPGVPWNHGAKAPPPFLKRGWYQPLPAPPGTRLPLPAPPGTPPGIYHRVPQKVPELLQKVREVPQKVLGLPS